MKTKHHNHCTLIGLLGKNLPNKIKRSFRDGTRIFSLGPRTNMSGQIGVPNILGGSQNLGDPPLRNSCCCYEKE